MLAAFGWHWYINKDCLYLYMYICYTGRPSQCPTHILLALVFLGPLSLSLAIAIKTTSYDYQPFLSRSLCWPPWMWYVFGININWTLLHQGSYHGLSITPLVFNCDPPEEEMILWSKTDPMEQFAHKQAFMMQNIRIWLMFLESGRV